jgi:hypothetical protein
MREVPIAAVLGFLLLGFLMGLVIYPKVLYWAKRYLNDFHGGKCAHCGRETFVTACHRCRKEVAFCHYYAILGTDVPDRDRVQGRRSAQICTECVTAEEKGMLENLLRD